MNMRNTKKIRKLYLTLGILLIIIIACSCSSEKAEYIGKDPWGNELTVSFVSTNGNEKKGVFQMMVDDGVEYSFVVPFVIEFKDDTGDFTVEGQSAEDKDISIKYCGIMELKDN